MNERIQRLSTQIELLKDCPHTKRKIRYRLASNGSKMFASQCIRCGVCSEWIPHNTIENPDRVEPIDDDLKDRYRETIYEQERELNIRKIKAERELAKKEFFDEYTEYLKSPEWQEKRRMVLNRADDLCEGCRLAIAKEVHHLTYENWGREFLFELVALCESCHKRYHGKTG